MNLPQVISFVGNRTITFVYDAGGSKLRKIVNNNGAYTYYDYVNGVEYRTEGVTYQNPVIQRIAHTEGSVSRQNDGSYLQEYVLRDHLGNTRVTFTDANNDGIVGVSDIKQINHFYSFGLNMEGNWNGSFPDAKNKYQYGEKELNTDFGLNWSDYGARMYDPATARWSVMDMLADKYRAYSPYNYCTNNPIIYIDPTGMAVEQVAGGYKYTGDDAIRVHNFFVSKSKNYYLAVIPKSSQALIDATNTNTKGASDREGWNVFAAYSIGELANLMAFVQDKSIKNIVIESHGAFYSELNEKAVLYNEKEWKLGDGFLRTGNINEYMQNGTGSYARSLQNIMNKVEDGGNCVFMSCHIGESEYGSSFLKAVNFLSGGRLNLFAPEDYVGIRTEKTINGVKMQPMDL